jgi:aerobic carbon-monoxide dehydrogenase medium subunit
MPFDYHAPTTLDEAFEVLTREGEAGAVLAGGTDLLLQMRRRVRGYRSVINIKAIPGLDELRYSPDEGLTCGALVTFRELEIDPNVRTIYLALSEAATVVAGVQLRNLATIGGNIGNASPSADSVPALVALGATATIAGPTGTRTLPVLDCFLGPGKTVLDRNELFTSFHIPHPPVRSGNAYQRLTPRSAMDIAVVSVGAYVELDASGHCKECRIALGAVSPTPLRALRAEAVLRGERVTPVLLERAGELAGEGALPITDIRGSSAYRRAMVSVLTRRVVELAAQRALSAG